MLKFILNNIKHKIYIYFGYVIIYTKIYIFIDLIVIKFQICQYQITHMFYYF